MKIEAPGLYKNFSARDYFADPTPEPSFTQSLAKSLLDQSPLHAKQAHPRLYRSEPDDEPEAEKYDKAKAIGNAAHSIMLERGKSIAVGEYENWKKKEAQEFKAAAIAAGQEPVLRKHYDTALDMVGEALAQLNAIHGCESAFTNGDAEVVIANCENGIWLRSMIDWLTPDLREIWDYKTSGMSASPYATGKMMGSAGWHIQAAFHERILDEIDPAGRGRRKHYFVAQENYEPFALTVNLIGESAMTIGRKQVDYAIKLWAHCLTKNAWPAYPPKIITPELPAWSESGWLAREETEADEQNSEFMMAG